MLYEVITQTTAGSGQPGSSPAIRIRGVGTLNTSADPLIILDGIQYDRITSYNVCYTKLLRPQRLMGCLS